MDFLNAARPDLLKSFDGVAERDMRILSVDLGTTGGTAGVFVGKTFMSAHQLRIVKLDILLSSEPEGPKTGLGLSVEHVNRHLERRASEAAEIAVARHLDVRELRDHDLRQLGRHTTMMVRDWVRLNASQIIQLAESENIDLILFESLRGFAPPAYNVLDLQRKRRVGFFAYGSIRRKVSEKAVERGMLVLTLPYKYSSQICSKCGALQSNHGLWRKNKKERKFVCEASSCGFEANSDENAARALVGVFWGNLRLPVQDTETP